MTTTIYKAPPGMVFVTKADYAELKKLRKINPRLIEKAPELRKIVRDMAGGKVMWTPGDMQGIITLMRYIDKG